MTPARTASGLEASRAALGLPPRRRLRPAVAVGVPTPLQLVPADVRDVLRALTTDGAG
jgi:hypothetical protein